MANGHCYQTTSIDTTMQTIKLILNAVPCTLQVFKTGQLAPLGLADPAWEVKIATMGDKTGETGNLAPLGLADTALEVKTATTKDKTGVLVPLGLKVKIATTTDKTGILAPLGMADPAVKCQVSSRDAKALELNPAMSVKIGSWDVDFSSSSAPFKLASQDVGLADPAMTVNIGIKDIDALGIANPSGTALTVNVVNDHKTVTRRLMKELMKVYHQDTASRDCFICGAAAATNALPPVESLDRLAPGGGYDDSNVRFACTPCNALAAAEQGGGGGVYESTNVRLCCMACPPSVNALTPNGDAPDDDAVIDYVNGLNPK